MRQLFESRKNVSLVIYELIYLEGQQDRVFQAFPFGLVSLGLLEFKDEENGNKI